MTNRVTEQDIDAAIRQVDFDLLKDGRTTVCTLTLDNGFTVRGESSVVDPANFDAELGKRYAQDAARSNVWQFLGFRLADRLHAERLAAASPPGTPAKVDGLTFGEAIAALRAGYPVSRAGWNGAGQVLTLQVPDEHSKMTLPYIYITTVSGDCVPWLASQSDMLASDWYIFP